jgi:formate hydrogenlyase subunit 3/multisubunit Na+/H+ antiporter MnhD subunit
MLLPVLLLIGGLIVCAILMGSRTFGRKLAAFLCLGILVAAVLHLLQFGGTADAVTLPAAPLGSALHLRLDGLSALFLLVITLPAAPVLWFAEAYARHGREAKAIGPLLILFVAALCAVPLADDTLSLLFAWEAMALTSWLLLIGTPAGAEAGKLYLGMAILSGLALVIGLALPPTYAPVAPAVLLIGCMAKAGIAPLHVWLPSAHAEAPSPASALMSAVMTKMAIYVLVRLWLAAPITPAWGWGLALAILGALSAVLALVQSLGERDLKRVLARSTIDNLGLIAVGIGLAVTFKSLGLKEQAGIVFTGAMIHIFAHGAMKALAFCGVASLSHLIGSRDIAQMGGISRRAPILSGLLAISGFGLAALPPFAGFTGIWLILQALLTIPANAPTLLRLAAPLLIVLLAIGGALALSLLVRGIGLTLFGRPRSKQAAEAHESPFDERLALMVLAGLTLAIGLLPGALLLLIDPGLRQIAAPPATTIWGGVLIGNGSGYSPLPIFAGLLILGTGLRWLLNRKAPHTRFLPAWACGYPDRPADAQVSPEGLAEPVLRIGAPLLADGARLLAPLKSLLDRAIETTDWLQRLSERAALAVVLAALAVLLTLVAATA